MIQYFIEVSLIWSLLILFYIYLLKKETFFMINRGILIAILLVGIILPLIQIPINSSFNNTIYGSVLDTIYVGSNAIISNVEMQGPAFSLSIYKVLFAIYLLGASLLSLKLVHGIWKIYNLYINGRKTKYPSYTEVEVDQEINPFSFFNWMFIPSMVKDSDSYEVVKSHEEKHIKEVHSFDIILFELVKIIFWFNPLVYLLKQEIIQVHEYIADQATLQHTDRKNYSQFLISYKSEPMQLALVNSLKNSIIKNRIIMMYQMKSNKLNKLKYLFILPLFLSMIYFISCTDKTQNTEEELEKMELSSKNDQTASEKNEITNADVFKVVEQMPRFPGCEDQEGTNEEIEDCAKQKMLKYIYENLKYPGPARDNGVEGMVVIQFVVNEKGSLEQLNVVRNIGSGCGDEVKRVVESMNNMEELWVPGKQRGKSVKVMYTLPVKFKLS